jgi:hypothetical protein
MRRNELSGSRASLSHNISAGCVRLVDKNAENRVKFLFDFRRLELRIAFFNKVLGSAS